MFEDIKVLKSMCFKLSKNEIEYLKYKFSDVTIKINMMMRLDTQVIIQDNEEIGVDVIHYIKTAWGKLGGGGGRM